MNSNLCLLMLFVFGSFSVWNICKSYCHMEYKTETTLIPSNKFDELFACQGDSLQTVEPPTCRLKTPEN